MTCPRCKCPECAKVELNRVLSRVGVSREAETDAINQQAVQRNRDLSAWRDTFIDPTELHRFLLPREPGKPPVDPDAEQLARDVLECARAG